MRSKCKCREPTWRSVPRLVEKVSGECPSRHLRCRRRPGSHPYFQDLREKKHAAPKRIRENLGQSVQSDLPIFQACSPVIRLERDNKPTPFAYPREPVSCRTEWAEPAGQTDDRRAAPCALLLPTRQSRRSFHPNALSRRGRIQERARGLEC